MLLVHRLETLKKIMEDLENIKIEEEEKTGELTVAIARENIKKGKKWLRQGHYEGSDQRWKRWEENQKRLMCNSDDAEYQVHSVFSNFNTVRPTLVFNLPNIKADATQPNFKKLVDGQVVVGEDGQPILVDNYKATKFLEIKINYELKQLKFKKILKKVLGDVLAPYGVGWIKWGYDQMSARDQVQKDSTSKKYWCKRVDPRCLVYDPMSTDNDECRYKAELLQLTKKQAKDFGIEVPEGYVATLPEFLKNRSDKSDSTGADDDLVLVWEYHDEVESKIHWVFDKYDQSPESENEEWAKPSSDTTYPFEGSCYVPLVLNENNEDIIGLSDVEPVEDQVIAISKGRTKQVNHVEHYGTVTYYEDGAILAPELENITYNDNGAFVKFEKGGIGKMQTVSTPAMGADDYNMDAVHKDDMRTVLGITSYQQGQASKQKTTATESSIVQNSANIRIADRRNIIKDFIIDNVERLSALIQTFGEEEEWVRIADLENQEDFVNVLKEENGFNPKLPFLHMKKEDYQVQCNFTFKVEDMIQRPPEVVAQQWIQYIGAMAPLQGVLQAEGISLGKVAAEVANLMGLDLDKVKETGPAQISVTRENMMFLDNMEVPQPHKKDPHDEHVVSHHPIVAELQKKLQPLAQQEAQITQLLQSGQVIDPTQAQTLQQLVQQTKQKAASLSMILRRVMLHVQEHSKMQSGGQTPQAPVASSPNPAQQDPNISKQAAITGQAGRAT